MCICCIVEAGKAGVVCALDRSAGCAVSQIRDDIVHIMEGTHEVQGRLAHAYRGLTGSMTYAYRGLTCSVA